METFKTVILLLQAFIFVYSEHFDHRSIESDEKIENDPLIFSHTLCRHGDRNIYEPYPNDPWKEEHHWHGGRNQLTGIGKQQHYKLGQYLRSRYRKMLGNDKYLPHNNNIYVRSTDVTRVIKSAESNLAGFFSAESENWDKQQPIPIHTPRAIDDFVLASKKPCDHLDYLMLQFMNTSTYTDYFIQHRPIITYLETKSGMKISSLCDISVLYDTLFIERLRGMRLPNWAEKAMKPGGDLEYLTFSVFAMLTVNPEMKRIKSGYLLKEILDRFTNKTQGTLSPDRSLWMYFAHDITISNMLNSLGLFELHAPGYASCLFFELYQGKDAPYVQLFYKKTLKTDLIPLNVPGCGKKCPLASLYQIYADILPTRSFNDECALRHGEILAPGIIRPVEP